MLSFSFLHTAELMDTERSRVDFGSLFSAINRPSRDPDDTIVELEASRSESRVSIIELGDDAVRDHVTRSLIKITQRC